MDDNITDDLKIYTVAEVAALLHVSKETVYTFVRSGQLLIYILAAAKIVLFHEHDL